MARTSRAKKRNKAPDKYKRSYIPVDIKGFKLEEGISIPNKKFQQDEFLKFFDRMKVNQSFEAFKRDRAKCRSAATDYEKDHPNIKFTIRTTDESGTFRMWKLKREAK